MWHFLNMDLNQPIEVAFHPDTLGELVAFVLRVSFCGGVLLILIRRLEDFLGGVLYVFISMYGFKSKPDDSLGPPTLTAHTSSCESSTSIAPWIF